MLHPRHPWYPWLILSSSVPVSASLYSCAFCLAFVSLASGAELTNAVHGKELFSGKTVPHLIIDIATRDLDSLRKNARDYVPCDLTVDVSRNADFQSAVSQTLASPARTLQSPLHFHGRVAVHLKGSTGSFRSVDDKPGLTLDFAKFDPQQRLAGLEKIHLNNSVEDPSYINAIIGSEIFCAAGVPAPRAAHAIVKLNGRRLGLYVLTEAFTGDFVQANFSPPFGGLYEPRRGQDVGDSWKKLYGKSDARSRAAMNAVARAVQQSDLNLRWNELQHTLDMDRFLSFVAVEIMLSHRDGYALAKNNFRIYEDRSSGKLVWLPQGLDQLFGLPELNWKPHLAGNVARAVLETPDGNRAFEERFRNLFTNVFDVRRLTNRIESITANLESELSRTEYRDLRAEIVNAEKRIVTRAESIQRQLSQPAQRVIEFERGVAKLSGWTRMVAPQDGIMDNVSRGGEPNSLHILATSKSSAWWKTSVRLPRGKFKFEARAKISDVKPLDFGRNQGAFLRVTGKALPPANFVGTSAWKMLVLEFTVEAAEEDVELGCELRAASGEVWFDLDSLRLVKLQ